MYTREKGGEEATRSNKQAAKNKKHQQQHRG